jgi:hypothetical protein
MLGTVRDRSRVSGISGYTVGTLERLGTLAGHQDEKLDAVSNPSNPHAHCVGGAKRFIGCKLHLGTAQLFKERAARALF